MLVLLADALTFSPVAIISLTAASSSLVPHLADCDRTSVSFSLRSMLFNQSLSVHHIQGPDGSLTIECGNDPAWAV